MPVPRVAESGSVEIPYSGDWFASGDCTLYVDGEPVASSSGAKSVYSLEGPEETWRSYRLTLKSGDEEVSRVITLYPYAGFVCSVHKLTQKNTRLDARPAGTTRRIHQEDAVNITWSGLWNDAADQSVVTLYRGHGTAGEPLGTRVSQEGRKEGEVALPVAALPLGQYTLTHEDGVETLVAYLNLTGAGLVLIMR